LQTPIAKHQGDDTRSRLIEAASCIFSERGYNAATTREICVRARANAAAVNYHFGDKLGLYKAALEAVIGARAASAEKLRLSSMQPEGALRSFIQAMFDNLGGSDGVDQYTRLMAHELLEPTPALALVVDQIIRPRARLLAGIVARLTAGSVNSLATRLAAQSIIAQIVHYIHARPVMELLWPRWPLSAAERLRLVDHVTDFSLAGLREVARAQRAKRGRHPPAT
jgi:AcrR family transcriptional regulator